MFMWHESQLNAQKSRTLMLVIRSMKRGGSETFKRQHLNGNISLELESQQSVFEFAGVRQGHTPWPRRARRESNLVNVTSVHRMVYLKNRTYDFKWHEEKNQCCGQYCPNGVNYVHHSFLHVQQVMDACSLKKSLNGPKGKRPVFIIICQML